MCVPSLLPELLPLLLTLMLLWNLAIRSRAEWPLLSSGSGLCVQRRTRVRRDEEQVLHI